VQTAAATAWSGFPHRDHDVTRHQQYGDSGGCGLDLHASSRWDVTVLLVKHPRHRPKEDKRAAERRQTGATSFHVKGYLRVSAHHSDVERKRAAVESALPRVGNHRVHQTGPSNHRGRAEIRGYVAHVCGYS
jgi:hypothetical protein